MRYEYCQKLKLTGMALLASATAVVSGCATDTDDVVALTPGTTQTLEELVAQRARAEALYGCLLEAELPVLIGPVDGDDKGQLAVYWDNEAISLVLSRDDRGGIWSTEGNTDPSSIDMAAYAQKIELFRRTDPFTFRLEVDGVDYSKLYASCMELSHYEEPSGGIDLVEELQLKGLGVGASNGWADCARENGFPGLADVPAPVADGMETMPMILLPRSITVAQVKTLVSLCPPRQPDWDGSHEGDETYGIVPLIGFNAPGYDGKLSTQEVTDEERGRFNEALAVLLAFEQAE